MTCNNGPLLYAVAAVVIASVWRRRKGRGGDREKESVREMVVGRGREGESSQWSRSLRYTARKGETRLTPCTRSPGLWDASVEREPCRYS